MERELWECIHHKKICGKEFCDKFNNFDRCGESCQEVYTFGQWRELLKTVPDKKGLK